MRNFEKLLKDSGKDFERIAGEAAEYFLEKVRNPGRTPKKILVDLQRNH